jgi:hypothetical protein
MGLKSSGFEGAVLVPDGKSISLEGTTQTTQIVATSHGYRIFDATATIVDSNVYFTVPPAQVGDKRWELFRNLYLHRQLVTPFKDHGVWAQATGGLSIDFDEAHTHIVTMEEEELRLSLLGVRAGTMAELWVKRTGSLAPDVADWQHDSAGAAVHFGLQQDNATPFSDQPSGDSPSTTIFQVRGLADHVAAIVGRVEIDA